MEEANRELAGQLKDGLWDGQIDQVIATLKSHSWRLVSPQQSDGPDHSRRVPANNLGYFQAHRHHMDYPAYRRKGWPIGSGLAESAVKQFNKLGKGTERFWSFPGAESVLSLRASCLSQDGRRQAYRNTRPANQRAA